MTASKRSPADHGARRKPPVTRSVSLNMYHVKQWNNFIQHCLATRLDADSFARFAPIQQRRHPVPPTVLADLLLRPPTPPKRHNGAHERDTAAATPLLVAQSYSSPIDPRVPAYLQVLLELRFVDVLSILRGMYRYSTSQNAREEAAATAAAIDAVQEGKGSDSKGRSIDGKDQDTDMTDAGRKNFFAKRGTKRIAGNAVGTGPVLWASSFNNEETLFYRITRAVRQENAVQKGRGALALTACAIAWIQLFGAATTSFAAAALGHAGMGFQIQVQRQTEMEASRAAFAMLLLAVCESEAVTDVLSQPISKGVRKALADGLASFTPTISLSSAPVALRLEHFRTVTLAHLGPPENDKSKTAVATAAAVASKREEAAGASDGIDDLLDSTVGLQNLVIPDIPISNTRAGLYIYLNAMLVGQPLVDDAAIFNYLHNRYQGDLQTTAIDLILASFDVLANAVFRSEGQTSAHLLRSFLINKVPLILVSLAASPLYPFDSQYCISEALSRVDTNAFPTMSSMFDDNLNANTFTDNVRQDFIFSCCLHCLIPEASIETLLGEITYQTLPAGGRYTKDQLVQQCLSDSSQIVLLIGQLENMDGNAGAVSQALVEMLVHFCRTRETAALKTLCNQLVRKPLAFDVLLLFERPATILHPLCQLLDGWRYDEDQSEYQPIYEEFGAALFLLMGFVYRYNLTIADLGIQWTPDSFVARVLSTGSLSRTLAELNEEERENLGNWIRGLFDTDAGGLSDDLMSSCPPQQFYMLTPTLFQQIVQALATGALPEDVLKGGIEYLVDTFLLPSLVTALTYLSDALLVDRPAEQKAILRVLHFVLQPASVSSEASLMLSALLNVVAKPLEHALRTYQRQDPRCQDVDPLLKTIKQNIPCSRRTAAAEHNELVNWAATAAAPTSLPNNSNITKNANNNNFSNTDRKDNTAGGLYTAMRQTMQGFVQWGVNPGVNVMPTSYTHRQFLASLSLLGAPRVLQLILDEVQRQTELGNGSVVYDVACALICARDVTNEPSPDNHINAATAGATTSNTTAPNTAAIQRRISLRQALTFKAGEWKKLRDSADPAEAALTETVVRLYRKVETQMMPLPLPPPPPPLPTDLTGIDVGATNASAVSTGGITGVGGDAMALDGVHLMGLDNANVATTEGGVAPANGANPVGDLGDLGDLGTLSNMDGLGELGDLGDLGMGAGGGTGVGSDGKRGSLDLNDQGMFGDMDLLNSWIDYAN